MTTTEHPGISTDKLGDFTFVRHFGHRIGSIERTNVPDPTGEAAYRFSWEAYSFNAGSKALIYRYDTEAEALAAVVKHWRANRGTFLA